jgi:hypothetical protein
MQWDIFISHASEDKNDVARPLAKYLDAAGLQIWLDENELRLGDSLRAKIDQGLAKSRFGLVIISRAFLEKDWPMRELDGLASLETRDRKVILPIWHKVDREEVARHSPTLASKFSVSTSIGIDAVAGKVLRDVYYFLGSNVFDHFHESDREWFEAILKVFNRPAFRGQYVGWSGHEPFQRVMKSITKTLNTGIVESGDGNESKNVRDMSQIKDQRLYASMQEVGEFVKMIDNLIGTNLPYPGNIPAVVLEINRLRDVIIIKMNEIWTAFRIHTLPVPTSVKIPSGQIEGTI